MVDAGVKKMKEQINKSINLGAPVHMPFVQDPSRIPGPEAKRTQKKKNVILKKREKHSLETDWVDLHSKLK